eukprot:GHVU01226336.1.p1 GENE.GHVU01226336.1~~GHVU01226336.1.p1  ORF type:complete len:347 (+),score=39.90 GHVU01226336.1:147-1043(+)
MTAQTSTTSESSSTTPAAPMVATITVQASPTAPAAPAAPAAAAPFLQTPLGREAQPHYNAQREQQDRQQRRGSSHPYQGGGGRGRRDGGQSGGGGGQGRSASYPATGPVLDHHGVQIGPCPKCNKPHRGRCWKCRDHQYQWDCGCPIPQLCMNCGLVAHTADTCQRPRPAASPATGANSAPITAPAPASPAAPATPEAPAAPASPPAQGVSLSFAPGVQVSAETLARIQQQMATVAQEELRLASAPAGAATGSAPAQAAAAPAAAEVPIVLHAAASPATPDDPMGGAPSGSSEGASPQ